MSKVHGIQAFAINSLRPESPNYVLRRRRDERHALSEERKCNCMSKKKNRNERSIEAWRDEVMVEMLWARSLPDEPALEKVLAQLRASVASVEYQLAVSKRAGSSTARKDR